MLAAPPPIVVTAPGGGVSAALHQRGHRLTLAINGDRKAVIATVKGIADGTPTVDRSRKRARFTTPAGKRRVHRLNARTATVRFGNGRGIQILAAGDGAAFRLIRPDPEQTTIRAPKRTESWRQAYRSDYENPYLIDQPAGRYAFPQLLRTRDQYTLLTETGTTRAAVSHTELATDGRLRLALPPGEPAPRRTPGASPWSAT